ncbi:MAG: holo-ACP synthase [Metamycoplasmataceae bacterium]
MIGVDITTISRFKEKDENFARKILSENEFQEFLEIENKSYYLATRWAIKEAIFKADNSFASFNKIDIHKNNNKYFFQNFHISTSHEGDFLIAFVLKENILK